MTTGRVTIVDVAKEAGVSPSTVSLVLRGDESISDATKQRVQTAIDETGYVYNRGAASLRENKSNILAVIIHDLTNPVFSEIAVGIDSVSQAGGFVQLIAHTSDDPERQKDVISAMREHKIAGLIISPAIGTSMGDYAPILDLDIPMVQVGRTIRAEVSAVVSDNTAGTSEAVRYLIGLGHRQIGYIGGVKGTTTFGERSDGYRQAMEEAGIEPLPILNSSPSHAGGVAAFDELRDVGLPSALVCFNDAVAFGVYDGMRKQGLEPGVDLSIVGFDDVPEAGFTFPRLTTVSIHPRRLGQTAAKLLLDLIAKNETGAIRITNPVTLSVRESCLPHEADEGAVERMDTQA